MRWWLILCIQDNKKKQRNKVEVIIDRRHSSPQGKYRRAPRARFHLSKHPTLCYGEIPFH
jgi:hypothetical protein